jgi:hypothetical protein
MSEGIYATRRAAFDVPGTKITGVLQLLVWRSQWFCAMPCPDDMWVLEVKEEISEWLLTSLPDAVQLRQ